MDGAPYAPALAARRARARDRADPPGAVALPAPHGGREHPDGRRAAAPRPAGTGDARAARTREVLAEFGHGRRSTPTRGSAGCRSAARQVVEICRAIATARARGADGRADEQPAARRRRAAVRADPPAAGRGRRRRLHQPLPRGGARRSPSATPCCATAAPWARALLAAVTNDELIAHMVGRTVERAVPDAQPARSLRAGAARSRASKPAGAARGLLRARGAARCSASSA